MSDVDLVDFKQDVRINESTRVKRSLVSFGTNEELDSVSANIIAYSLFDSDQISEIENAFDEMTDRAAKGKLRVDTVNVEKRERRLSYQFGRGYKMGRSRDEVAKMKNDMDVSPIPEWVSRMILAPMVKSRLVPPDWIDSVEINDFRRGGYKIPSVDPVKLFLRPSFTIPLLADSAVCFGAKYYYDDEPVFSDPRFRLPAYRGVLFKMQGYASDTMNHCVRPVDTTERFVTITLRRSCGENAPQLRALSKGQSLRNFDEEALERLKRAIGESKSAFKLVPYVRNFELIKSNNDNNPSRLRTKEKKGLSFLKKSKSGTKRERTPPAQAKLEKTAEDERWQFGQNSPEGRVKTEWSSDEEIDKRTGQKRTKYREAKQTNDVTDILMEYGQRASGERELDYKQIERAVHMKKSRKERGREFRARVNAKFGFKPDAGKSGSSSSGDEDEDNERQEAKKTARIRPFHL